MDRDAAGTGLSAVETALAGIEIAGTILGSPVGPVPDQATGDIACDTANVLSVAPPDWAVEGAGLVHEQSAGLAEPVPDALCSDAPPPDAGMGGVF